MSKGAKGTGDYSSLEYQSIYLRLFEIYVQVIYYPKLHFCFLIDHSEIPRGFVVFGTN
jgi:hypothetical protein